MSTESLACTYAALLLHDAGVPVTADNISAAVKAAGVEVRPTLPIIFARFLEKKSVDSLMAAAAAVAPAAAEAPAAAAGGAAPAAGGKAKEEKKKEVEEEGDDDMGFGLFD
ncbi:putative mitochondrial 60s acidic ribosomal protein P2 [Leptomonas pyrrhocoris]|nr:putative mitochondrial 60s acidic ribosomal protein P2 [Leptomonas pyrrhocoris]KPA73622.1 putative mitochondrial 60s acidic ribosomal protein P2 [Leptomonas pyrrhocoris]|eukprot:XP_015652061.1 putative mitochondrial 60s acidic ribosomal protein P2 [Leptomonas pyrrhocoris]